MKSKQEVLLEIRALINEYSLTEQEIHRMFSSLGAQHSKSHLNMQFFSYLGGIFIFAGIATYVGMFWEQLDSFVRVGVTLGPGLLFYLAAVLLEWNKMTLGEVETSSSSEIIQKNKSQHKAIIPLFLIAAFLIPTGLFVTLNEFSTGKNWRLASLLVFGILFVQQFITFLKIKKTTLLFLTLCFGMLTYGFALDLFYVEEKIISFTLGVSLLCIAYGINFTPYRAITPFWYFIGTLAFLCGLFEILRYSYYDIFLIAICAGMIYLSTVQKSKTILIVSTLFLLGYIGYFTHEHFVDSLGWPIALILLGLLFFAIGIWVLRISAKMNTPK